ncbi:hypothetical protein B0A52_06247 [Exophiala mesophila]|uniref:Leucine-rich repeat-containing protein 40 n=1 Tax=Exophiala mesophila TaxID=212818 RepID=A0A438N358_EXOME|nr:hypothetical protein B0A52_06247 [Exophiala mesophila]
MDDLDLPPMPVSARKSAEPQSAHLSSAFLRKRSRADYDDDDVGTSSDPALFSSDEQAPGAENYVMGKRKKHTYQGSWWSHRQRTGNGKKREFRRNYDSGIFMGSETSDGSLSSDSFGLEDEFLKDQQNSRSKSRFSVSESLQTTPKAIKIQPRMQTSTIPSEHETVREIVTQALELGKEEVDLSSLSLSSLPDQVSDLRTLCKQADIVPGMLDIGSNFESKLQLYLASNLLTQFPSPILDLQNLRVLSLRNNNLTTIPPTIRELVNLEVLNVASNQLRELPFELIELARFHNLSKIICNPNPWYLDEAHSADDPESLNMSCETMFMPQSKSPGTILIRAKVQSLAPGDVKEVQQSSVPSLTELVLRQLSKTVSRSQPDLGTFMPSDTPQSILEPLK